MLGSYVSLLISRFCNVVNFLFLLFAGAFPFLVYNLLNDRYQGITSVAIVIGIMVTIVNVIMPSAKMIDIINSNNNSNNRLTDLLITYNCFKRFQELYFAVMINVFILLLLSQGLVKDPWEIPAYALILPSVIVNAIYFVLPTEEMICKHYGYSSYSIRKMLNELSTIEELMPPEEERKDIYNGKQ